MYSVGAEEIKGQSRVRGTRINVAEKHACLALLLIDPEYELGRKEDSAMGVVQMDQVAHKRKARQMSVSLDVNMKLSLTSSSSSTTIVFFFQSLLLCCYVG
jgi:hypothetical protein